METNTIEESLSVPKVRKLSWNWSEEREEMEASTPFGSYKIHKRRNGVGYILRCVNINPAIFEKEMEAVKFAQRDFEARVKQCLE